MQDDADEGVAAAQGGEDEAASGLRRPTCFDTDGAFVVVEQIIDVGPFVKMVAGGGGNGVVFRTDDLRKEGNRHGIAGQAHEVVSGCVVDAGKDVAMTVGDFQAVGVGVVRLVEMQSLRLKVHDGHEIRYRASDVVGNCHRRVIAGGQHQSVEQVTQRQFVAWYQTRAAAAVLRHLVQRVLPDGNFLVEIAGLDSDNGGHNLGGTRHRQCFLRVLAEEDIAGVGVKQDRCRRGDGRRFALWREDRRGNGRWRRREQNWRWRWCIRNG